jgi:F0F1-type ATP synthase membrane subunit b/b'
MLNLRARGRGLVLAGGLFLASAGLLPTALMPPAVARPDERHPHIRRALAELREAKQELEKADHDFGGHRAEAVKAVDQAIRQLEKALKYDRQ